MHKIEVLGNTGRYRGEPRFESEDFGYLLPKIRRVVYGARSVADREVGFDSHLNTDICNIFEMYAAIAQRILHLTTDQKNEGSNPSSRTSTLLKGIHVFI